MDISLFNKFQLERRNKMKNIVRYFDGGLPINRCNLHCSYCYVSQDVGLGWNQKIDEKLNYSLEHMKYSLRPERLGGSCMFNFVASGEPLLFGQLTEMIEMVTSLGHYARVVTNGTPLKPLQELANLPRENLDRLTIKFSMHYLALRDTGLLERFFNNVAFVRDNKISYSVELCASDNFIPYLDEIKGLCMDKIGALPQVVELRDQSKMGFPRLTTLPVEDYQRIWQSFESLLFNYETRNYENYQELFCYGGDYGITFSWQTGDATQCSCQGNKAIFNIFENPDTPLIFAAVGNNCPAAHCFTNYVWCVLVGNYQGEEVPTYEEERDRITRDGEHWLSPTIREVYSHRCSEFHTPYSDDKKFYINKLMQKSYKGLEPSKTEVKKLANIVEKFMLGRGHQSVAIYGMGGMGIWLLNILSHTNLKLQYGIDLRGNKIKSDVPIFCPNENLPNVDVIIVSVYAEYNHIIFLLKKYSKAAILSILELAD